jgi:hypothetical protein
MHAGEGIKNITDAGETDTLLDSIRVCVRERGRRGGGVEHQSDANRLHRLSVYQLSVSIGVNQNVQVG